MLKQGVIEVQQVNLSQVLDEGEKLFGFLGPSVEVDSFASILPHHKLDLSGNGPFLACLIDEECVLKLHVFTMEEVFSHPFVVGEPGVWERTSISILLLLPLVEKQY